VPIFLHLQFSVIVKESRELYPVLGLGHKNMVDARLYAWKTVAFDKIVLVLSHESPAYSRQPLTDLVYVQRAIKTLDHAYRHTHLLTQADRPVIVFMVIQA
jgi:hypothetical protein